MKVLEDMVSFAKDVTVGFITMGPFLENVQMAETEFSSPDIKGYTALGQ